jgi:8-oxo-dGTP pyrophosphatase MutT (NUDIX family)
VEFREPLKNALKREYYEETGIAVQVGVLAYVAEIIDGLTHYVVLDYLVSADSWTGKPDSDIDRLDWVSAENWRRLPLAQGMECCLGDTRVRKLVGWDVL